MAASRAEQATKEVFDLYRKYGNQDYIGEPVSQQEHMIQCAMLAEKEGYSDEVVLGVFLHDIGHLIGFDKSLPPMGDVGTHAHEIIGEQFLKDLGFPDGVTSFVRGHVDAKRYLVCKYPEYHEQLTSASKKTLVFQGGPMTIEEAEKFEKMTHFEALIKMRNWDDQGKIKGAPVDSLDKYENMCKRFLESVLLN
ncbi:hypothetical protein ACROYT_G034898 [Oculina patagonica]